MSNSGKRRTNDELKAWLKKIWDVGGCDPAMLHSDSLEKFIIEHEMLDRGPEWVEYVNAARAVSKACWEYSDIAYKLYGKDVH